MYPKTIPPIRFGIKKTVLKRFVPLSFCVSAIAKKKAIILMIMIVAIAKASVRKKECRYVASANSFL